MASNDNVSKEQIERALKSLQNIQRMLGGPGSYSEMSPEEKMRQRIRNARGKKIEKTRKELGSYHYRIGGRKTIGEKIASREKLASEISALKKLGKSQLKDKPESLLTKRKALIEASNIKTPTRSAAKSLLKKFALKSIPVAGSLLSAFGSKPAGAGSSLDGK